MARAGEAEANAQLIAAAPELLEVLRQAPEPNTMDVLAWLHHYSQWYHRERDSALARAEGKT